jgi:large subunit ribosomal protein L10
MSKTVKQIIMRDYVTRVAGHDDALLISIRGMKGVDTTRMRAKLRGKKIKVTVIRNSLARKAFESSALNGLAKLLTGPSALAIGEGSVVEVARELVDVLKEFPQLELRGALLDGTLFEGKAGVEELSRFPTRSEAIAQVVTLVVSPARKLVAQVKGPGSTVAGIVKAIETKLEKGEAIAKKAG